MKPTTSSRSIQLIALLALSMPVFTLHAEPPKKGKKPPLSPEEHFKKLDTNHNGKLTLNEFTFGTRNLEKDKAEFKSLDKDGDGLLSLEEFSAKHQEGEKQTEEDSAKKKDSSPAK